MKLKTHNFVYKITEQEKIRHSQVQKYWNQSIMLDNILHKEKKNL